MPPRSPFPMFGSGSDSRAALLQGLMIGAIVIGAMWAPALGWLNARRARHAPEVDQPAAGNGE